MQRVYHLLGQLLSWCASASCPAASAYDHIRLWRWYRIVYVKQAFDRYLFPSVTSLPAQCGLEKVHGA